MKMLISQAINKALKTLPRQARKPLVKPVQASTRYRPRTAMACQAMAKGGVLELLRPVPVIPA